MLAGGTDKLASAGQAAGVETESIGNQKGQDTGAGRSMEKERRTTETTKVNQPKSGPLQTNVSTSIQAHQHFLEAQVT